MFGTEHELVVDEKIFFERKPLSRAKVCHFACDKIVRTNPAHFFGGGGGGGEANQEY